MKLKIQKNMTKICLELNNSNKKVSIFKDDIDIYNKNNIIKEKKTKKTTFSINENSINKKKKPIYSILRKSTKRILKEKKDETNYNLKDILNHSISLNKIGRAHV